MRVFIVDDTRLARQELRTLLQAWPDCEVIGEAADVASAREAVDREKPDVLLLDIHMPGATGFDLLDQLDHVPIVIFTTAYDQYALQAFDRNALDYLVKPIEAERLGTAIDRARQRLAVGAAPGGPAPVVALKGADDTIFVRDGERCWFVRLAEVSGFEVMGNYARAWFGGQQPLLSRSLGYLEERLDPNLFFRASRSHLINLRWVTEIEPSMSDGYLVKLKDGRQVEISRRQAKVLRERLEI
jgi:two-component system, LytTR family, response regulator